MILSQPAAAAEVKVERVEQRAEDAQNEGKKRRYPLQRVSVGPFSNYSSASMERVLLDMGTTIGVAEEGSSMSPAEICSSTRIQFVVVPVYEGACLRN